MPPTSPSLSIHTHSITRRRQRGALRHQHPKPRLFLDPFLLRQRTQHLTSIGVLQRPLELAMYRWIYAMPKGELAREGIILQSKRTMRKRRRPLGERTGGRIIGMVSIDDRPEIASDRRVPGSWEGDLVVGKAGKTAVATLVERSSRFLIMLGLPEGKKAAGLADVLIDRVNDLPALMRGALTWDQGTEMARHAQLTVATDLPVYFAHPHSPWERGTNENTNRLIREYLPKGIEITSHQPYLDAIADELNDRPRATLGYLTPREVFTKLLNDNVATTA
ncbi:IS30 family transposase [Arthrobacter sp. CAN_C5]|uniref:IS30 family transposase n=1 Tax=Arthrobacter sp. CAN_C5 TaxID=2760706 RepID=UPI0037C0DEE3